MNKIEITPQLLAELKEKAKKATPGPWILEVWSGQGTAVHVKQELIAGNGALVASYVREPCAEYIAAANPQVVLALVEKIERLEEDFDTAARSAAEESVKAVRLEEEANWLADRLRELCPNFCQSEKCTTCWREAARKAVEEQCKAN